MTAAAPQFTFQAVLELHGRTATGVRVPAEVVDGLGGGKRPAVRVTINGHTYRSSVAVMGGEFMLGVSAEQRASAGVAAGDRVDVALELDTEPREVTVPADLAAALAADDEARRFFEALSYSNRLRYALSVETAKKPETRERRIAAAVSALRAGRAQG
ncbi:MAG: YdeI/OmpD-associated family protein [Actinomycetota bacterium]|nr:YdeI/OmpD-associated family protein [Actinomycetota bacterium]